jgi:hypothetical protein
MDYLAPEILDCPVKSRPFDYKGVPTAVRGGQRSSPVLRLITNTNHVCFARNMSARSCLPDLVFVTLVCPSVAVVPLKHCTMWPVPYVPGHSGPLHRQG